MFVIELRAMLRAWWWMRGREAIRLAAIVILTSGTVVACVEKKPVLAPATRQPPPKARPARQEPPPPPPTLSPPQVGYGREDQLREEAKDRVEAAERIVMQIDRSKVPLEQQDTFLTIQSFLVKAKEAFSVRDFLMAFTLADKAKILGEELLDALPR